MSTWHTYLVAPKIEFGRAFCAASSNAEKATQFTTAALTQDTCQETGPMNKGYQASSMIALPEGSFSLLIFSPPLDFASDGIFLRDENGENFKPRGLRVLTGSA